MKKYMITYRTKPRGEDYASVWTEANSKEEAIDYVKSEYWDIDEIVSISII